LEVEGGGPTDPVIIHSPYPGLSARGKDMTSGRPSRKLGITLAEVLVGAVAVVLLLAILLPVWVRAARYDGLKACIGNLQALHRAQSGLASPEAHPLGSAYWTRLLDAKPPLVAPSALLCPLAAPVAGRICEYRGPARPVGPLDAAAVIGCDDEHNHGEHGQKGGNILRKSGVVVTDQGGVWRDALQLHCVR
jgi:hypothetical protein